MSQHNLIKPKYHHLRDKEVQNPCTKSKNHCVPGDATEFLRDYGETNEWEREEHLPHVSASVPAGTECSPCRSVGQKLVSLIPPWWVMMLCSVCLLAILVSCELSQRPSLAPKLPLPCSGDCSCAKVLTHHLQSSHCCSRKHFGQHGPKCHRASEASILDIEPESIFCEAMTDQQEWMRVSAVTCVTRMLHSNGLHEKELPQCFLITQCRLSPLGSC